MASYSRRRGRRRRRAPVGETPGEPARSTTPADTDPLDLPEEDQLVYDLSDWPLDVHADVAAALAEAGIAHSWLGTDLVVHERHEDRADGC